MMSLQSWIGVGPLLQKHDVVKIMWSGTSPPWSTVGMLCWWRIVKALEKNENGAAYTLHCRSNDHCWVARKVHTNKFLNSFRIVIDGYACCANCFLSISWTKKTNAHRLSLRLILMMRRTRICVSYVLFNTRSMFRIISIPSFSLISSPHEYCLGVVLNSAYTTCCFTRSSTTSRTILSKILFELMSRWITSNSWKQLHHYALFIMCTPSRYVFHSKDNSTRPFSPFHTLVQPTLERSLYECFPVGVGVIPTHHHIPVR